IWDSTAGTETHCLKGHDGIVWSVAFSRDGTRLASASTDNSERASELKVWDAASGKELLTIPGYGRGIQFSPDGRQLAGSAANGVKIWDAATGRELLSLPGHVGGAAWRNCVAYSPDGRRIVSGVGATVQIWDVRTGQAIYTLQGHSGDVNGVAFSPDGTLVASASADKTARIWDAATGKQIFSLKADKLEANGLAFSPDGRWLATIG